MENQNQQPLNVASSHSNAANFPPSVRPGVTISDEEAERVLADAARRAKVTDAKTAPKRLPSMAISVESVVAKIEPFTESETDAAERRERANASERQRLLSQAAIPERYKTASLNDVSQVPLKDRAKYEKAIAALRVASTGGSIVGLCGSRGPGKTHMVCALVTECCNQLIRARYTTAMNIFLAIKREYGRQGGDESKAEQQFLEPALLVIDEIQVRGETPWEDVRLTHMLDTRYANKKTTILVTNLTKDKLTQSVGESITDRFFDFGGVIECGWESLRGRLIEPTNRVMEVA